MQIISVHVFTICTEKEIDNYFGTSNNAQDVEAFSNNVRSAIYLFGMGNEVDSN